MDQQYLERGKKVRVTNSSPFPLGAVYGSLEGEPVTITHIGDAEGMSPVFHVIDSKGRAAWVQQAGVVINDPRFLPTRTEEAQESANSRRSSSEFPSASASSR